MKPLSSLLLCILLFLTMTSQAQDTVTFDTENVKAGMLDRGLGSMNLCWLLDSDVKRPRTHTMLERIREMKCGSLRFPYGHLANNYLWDTPPYGGTLTPKVAATTVVPGTWSWATDDDGYFLKDMDFNEFMDLCAGAGSKPLVVVNVLSYKYANGPLYDTLKKVAVEWVKYARDHELKVAYWQLGNEMDHHQDLMTKAEYVALYIDFVTAMKAADSTIHCGPGILSGVGYFNDIMAQAPELVDFTSCHQYLFGKPWPNYPAWRDSIITGTTSNINGMQNAVDQSSKSNLPILITETSAFGNWSSNTSNPLFKGLAWFDVLFEEQQYEDVKYTYMWNSHTPWSGEANEEAGANAWWNNDDNSLTAMGWPVYILNRTLEEKYMIPDQKIHGKTLSYGAHTPSTGNMVIYLLNKDTATTTLNVKLNHCMADTTTYERWVFTGNNAWDKYPTFTQTGSISFTEDGFSSALPPHSLVVVKLHTDTPHCDYSHASHQMFFKNNKHGMSVQPNPVVAGSNVVFSLTQTSHVALKLYNKHGEIIQVLKNESMTRGDYTIYIDTKKMLPGICFLELMVTPANGQEAYRSTQKLIYR